MNTNNLDLAIERLGLNELPDPIPDMETRFTAGMILFRALCRTPPPLEQGARDQLGRLIGTAMAQRPKGAPTRPNCISCLDRQAGFEVPVAGIAPAFPVCQVCVTLLDTLGLRAVEPISTELLSVIFSKVWTLASVPDEPAPRKMFYSLVVVHHAILTALQEANWKEVKPLP